MGENVFQILEIEPTNDKKEIKKAYARLVKRYHPEEYPEEWKKIHDAYELALKIAQYVKAKEPETEDISFKQPFEPETEPEPSRQPKKTPPVLVKKLEATANEGKKEKPPVVEKTEPTDVQPKKTPIVLEKKQEAEPETTEVTDTEEEMDSLFQDIGKLSREQQRQNEEERKKALEAAVAALRQMAAKRRLNQKEWEAFFGREDMQPVICTGEFLYELGECFNNKTIDTKMYDFLLGQLTMIERYQKERNIKVSNAGVSDPLGYAKSKIYSACKAKWMVRDLITSTGAFMKAMAWLLVAALSVTGMYLRWRNLKGTTTRQWQYEENDSSVHKEIWEEMQRMNEKQEEIKEELSQSIELVGMGDTREKMISLYGEPDILQKDPENSDYEDAVYHLYGVDMTITLYFDVVMSVRYEISQDENEGE